MFQPTVTPYFLKRPTMNNNERDASRLDQTNADQGPGPALMGANTLIGNDVFNEQYENLGKVMEIMLDMRRGRIAYAVLSFGGFLGMGEKLFAVPWSALTLDTKNRRFVMNTQKVQLENAPGFNADNWPNMANPAWEKDIHAYYGITPYADDDES